MKLLHTLFGCRAGVRTVPRTVGRELACRRLILEGLEDRTALSIFVPVEGEPGQVTLVGTDGPDQFVIRVGPTLGPVGTRFQFSDDGGNTFVDVGRLDVTRVVVKGLGGDDRLTIDHDNGFVGNLSQSGLPITYDGGEGFDDLFMVGTPGGEVHRTFTPGPTEDRGTIAMDNDALFTTVRFVRVESVIDAVTDTAPPPTEEDVQPADGALQDDGSAVVAPWKA